MKYLLPLFIFVFYSSYLGAQDLYSPELSRKFADYLFVKGEYDFAEEEYARLFFLNPHNDSLLVRLSQSYRKQGKFETAHALFNEFRPEDLGSAWVEQEYLATLLFQRDTAKFEMGNTRIKHAKNDLLLRNQIELAMLNRDWNKASSYTTNPAVEYSWMQPYRQTIASAQAFRPKKPWLAATYSAILPGSGKVYSKNAKEGITSFFFVTALGYQSYRAFHKRGTKTVTGWIYGGLSLGFYFGNIYGANQSAKNYNKRKLDAIYHEVDQIIYNRY